MRRHDETEALISLLFRGANERFADEKGRGMRVRRRFFFFPPPIFGLWGLASDLGKKKNSTSILVPPSRGFTFHFHFTLFIYMSSSSSPSKIDEEIVGASRGRARPDALARARPRAAPSEPPRGALSQREPRGAPQQLVLALDGRGAGRGARRRARAREIGPGRVLGAAAGSRRRRGRGARGARQRGGELAAARAPPFGDAGGDGEARFALDHSRRWRRVRGRERGRRRRARAALFELLDRVLLRDGPSQLEEGDGVLVEHIFRDSGTWEHHQRRSNDDDGEDGQGRGEEPRGEPPLLRGGG